MGDFLAKGFIARGIFPIDLGIDRRGAAELMKRAACFEGLRAMA